MAQENKVLRRNIRSQRLSRCNSYVKDEELERILQDVESLSKNIERDSMVTENDTEPTPDEEMDRIFEEVERRNAVLQESLLTLDKTRDRRKEQRQSLSSTELRKSADSLVEELMKELKIDEIQHDLWPRRASKSENSKKLNSQNVCKMEPCSKRKVGASEEEFDAILSELLEL